MSSSEEFYVGAYIAVDQDLNLDDAIYKFEPGIKVDTFIDCSEYGPNVWISNYSDDNIIQESEACAYPLGVSIAGDHIEKFRTKFARDLSILDANNVKYEVKFGAVTYWS